MWRPHSLRWCLNVAFRFARADNASRTKAGKAFGLRSHKYSCLMFIYSVALHDFSILLPNFAMMSSHSPALSFSFLLSRFIGRARICVSSDAHMLGHFLIVFHIKQPCLMWSCTGTAHVKISGQLGLGRGKADTCLPYK